MTKDEVLLLISIMSLLGSAYVMKKFSPLLKEMQANNIEHTGAKSADMRDGGNWMDDIVAREREKLSPAGDLV